MKIVFLSVIFIIALFPSFAHSGSTHSETAGLRWQMTDDAGWSAHYQRLGIKGTIEDQTLISFVEAIDGAYREDSILEVFVTRQGKVRAHRMNAGGQKSCLYTGQINNVPTMLNQGWSLNNRTSSVRGAYSCKAELKSGEWSGTISW